MANWMPKANATGGGVLDLEAYKRSILEKAGINPEGSKRPKSAGNSTSASEKLKDQKAAETIEPPKEVRQKKALVIGELQENFKALTNGNGNAASTAPPPTPPKPTISQPIRHSDSSGDNGWISVGSLQQPSDNKLSIEVPSDQHKAEGKRDSESHEIPEFMVSPGSHPSQSTRREAYHRYIQKIKDAGEQPYHLNHISSVDSTHSGSVKERVRDFAHIIEKEMGGGSQHSSRPASTTPTQLPPAPIHKIIRTESVEQRRIYPPPSVPVKPKFPPNITVDDSSQLQDSFEPFGDSSNVAQSQEVSHVAYLAEINRANKEVSSRIEEFERNSAPDTGSKSISVPPLKLSSLQVPGERRPKVEKSKPKYTERRQTTLDQDSFDQWSPPAEEFEKLRRDVVKQQAPRSPRTPEWRKSDTTEFRFDPQLKTAENLQSDYIAWPPPPPPEKLYPRRNLAGMSTEPSDKPPDQHAVGGDLPGSAESSDSKPPVGRGDSRRLYLPNTVKVKSLWESRIDQAKAPAEVSSKRWKSLEVITASLSLPKDQTDLQLTSPPEDYSRSLDRRRLKEQQRADSNANGSVTSGRISQLSKGRSVDNLSAARGRSPHMWFDTQRIKEAISHESIGDAGQTKSMWEKMSDTNASPRRNGADHTNSATLPRHHKVYDHQGNNNNSNISKTNGKRLTEASEEIRENLNVIEREIEDYKQREREMKAQGILKPFERRNITGTPVVQQSYSQEFHISQPPPSAGRMTGEEDFEMEKELLLLYIRSKPQVLESLGVHLPSELKKGSGAPSYGPKVELRPVGESYPLQRSTNRAMEDSVSSYNGSNNSTLERIPSHLKGNAGRYQKNVRGTTVVNKRITSRKPSFDSVRDSPVQKRSSSANNGEDLDNGRKHIGPRPTENLILYEIMEQREREEELRRSRSSLGLPSLDDILTNWRSATPTFHSPGFTLKSSQSFDHLTHAVENEIMEQSYRQRQPLSTSMDQLHLAEMSAYDPYRSSNFASLNRPAKQTKMERNIPINYNGAEPEGYKSVSRVQLVPPNHQQQHQQQQSNNEAKPMIVRQPSALSTGAAGSAQLPRMYSLLRSPVEKSFEKLVKQAGSSRPVVEIPPTYRRRVEFVPVETRIEQEVEELRQREEELRRQRLTMGLNYNPIGLQEVEGSEDAFSTASTGSEVRHREYVGQRNPTFTPTYSPDTFDYDRHAEFNQVNRSRNQSNFNRFPNR